MIDIAEENIRYLGDVQRLTLGPNDIVVLTVGSRISTETALRLKTWMQDAIGTGNKVVVIDSDIKVGVLAAPE